MPDGIEIQLKKGVLDLCVLALLSEHDSYAYEIASRLAELIGMGEGTLMVVVALFYFRIPFTGSFMLLYGGMSTFLLAVIGIGLFISTLARTQQQAILGTFSCMVPMVLLSGFASPVENMADWLQVVTLANPVRHFIVIVKGVFLKAMPARDVLHSLWPLIAIAAVTLTASTRLFHRRAE